MNTRSDQPASQIKVYLEQDGSVHKEIGPVPTESLVFEGGGMRGVGYIGATRALFETGIMNTVKRVAGTSAGAVTALIIALGYEQEDIERLLITNNLPELMGTNGLFTCAKISKLIKFGYFNDGDKLLEKGREFTRDRVIELISDYQLEHVYDAGQLAELEKLSINPERVTFQDLGNLARLMPQANIKDLYIIAAKYPDKRRDVCDIKIFSAEHTPNVEVALATRASISIPILLKPVELDGSKYVDGGCIRNFPVDIFNGLAYQPVTTYMFQGNNHQNFSTMGIKIDTEEEVRELLHAPIRKKPLGSRMRDAIVDHVSGLPISTSYKMNHCEVRAHYSHRSCQIGDEGIKTTQFDLSPGRIKQLINRGYEDMTSWIRNYHNGAIESRKFSSYETMCENMSLEELEKFCNEMMKTPQNILQIGGDCAALVSDKKIRELQDKAIRIYEEKLAAREIIRVRLPDMNSVLRKYNSDLVTLYSRLQNQHEVSDVEMWVAAAEQAVKIILDSHKNNFIKKDDVMKITKFVEEIRSCSVRAKSLNIGIFYASQKMSAFSLPRNICKPSLLL